MVLKNIPDEKRKCPRTGFSHACRDLVLSGACQDRWVDLTLRNPQTPDTVERRWGCVDDLALMVNLAIEARLMGVQAAVEKRGDAMIQATLDGITRQQLQHREAIGLAGCVPRELPPPALPKFLIPAPEDRAYGEETGQLALFDSKESMN